MRCDSGLRWMDRDMLRTLYMCTINDINMITKMCKTFSRVEIDACLERLVTNGLISYTDKYEITTAGINMVRNCDDTG